MLYIVNIECEQLVSGTDIATLNIQTKTVTIINSLMRGSDIIRIKADSGYTIAFSDVLTNQSQIPQLIVNEGGIFKLKYEVSEDFVQPLSHWILDSVSNSPLQCFGTREVVTVTNNSIIELNLIGNNNLLITEENAYITITGHTNHDLTVSCNDLLVTIQLRNAHINGSITVNGVNTKVYLLTNSLVNNMVASNVYILDGEARSVTSSNVYVYDMGRPPRQVTGTITYIPIYNIIVHNKDTIVSDDPNVKINSTVVTIPSTHYIYKVNSLIQNIMVIVDATIQTLPIVRFEEEYTVKVEITGTTNLPPTISYWDVVGVHDISELFNNRTDFDQPLDNWNTRNIKTMKGLFRNTIFNQPLYNWNTSSVTNMSEMFCLNPKFNQPINRWNVSKLTNSKNMFKDSNFNRSLFDWNVSNLTDAKHMFHRKYDKPLNSWTLKLNKPTNLGLDRNYPYGLNNLSPFITFKPSFPERLTAITIIRPVNSLVFDNINRRLLGQFGIEDSPTVYADLMYERTHNRLLFNYNISFALNCEDYGLLINNEDSTHSHVLRNGIAVATITDNILELFKDSELDNIYLSIIPIHNTIRSTNMLVWPRTIASIIEEPSQLNTKISLTTNDRADGIVYNLINTSDETVTTEIQIKYFSITKGNYNITYMDNIIPLDLSKQSYKFKLDLLSGKTSVTINIKAAYLTFSVIEVRTLRILSYTENSIKFTAQTSVNNIIFETNTNQHMFLILAIAIAFLVIFALVVRIP